MSELRAIPQPCARGPAACRSRPVTAATAAPPVHDLLLALAGRLDDDLLAWARELLAVGEEDQAVELATAALAAERVVLPPTLRGRARRGGARGARPTWTSRPRWPPARRRRGRATGSTRRPRPATRCARSSRRCPPAASPAARCT